MSVTTRNSPAAPGGLSTATLLLMCLDSSPPAMNLDPVKIQKSSYSWNQYPHWIISTSEDIRGRIELKRGKLSVLDHLFHGNSRQRVAASCPWKSPRARLKGTIPIGAELIPIPCVRVAFGTAVLFLETVNKSKRNRENLKDLCGTTLEIMTILREGTKDHEKHATPRLAGLVEDFISTRGGLHDGLERFLQQRRGFRGAFQQFLRSTSIAEEIIRCRIRIQELRLNVLLMMPINTHLHVIGIHQSIAAPEASPFTLGFRNTGLGNINLLYDTAMRNKTQRVNIFIARISGEAPLITVAQYENGAERVKSEKKHIFHFYGFIQILYRTRTRDTRTRDTAVLRHTVLHTRPAPALRALIFYRYFVFLAWEALRCGVAGVGFRTDSEPESNPNWI
ncbi:hypothetical protein DFH09DRAFT_1069425 [Mycena vulgaris]|nr:hypothetical protein DFH09DRAFT_1069425 [Mycena vulgaris]